MPIPDVSPAPASSIVDASRDGLKRVRTANREHIAQHVCAFLNGEGGVIQVGVDMEGRAVGVFSDENEAQEEAHQLEEFLWLHLSPRAACSITPEESEGRFLLTILVPPGPAPPYSLEGRIWLRVGATSQPAKGEQLSALLLRPRPQGVRWERQVTPGATLDDLDLEEVERAGREATKHHFWDGQQRTAAQILDAWGLLDYDTPTNAALVLFGRAPARRFPQTRVRLAHFSSLERDVFTTRVLEGHVFQLLRGILEFLQLHLPVRSQLSSSSLLRQEKTLYPFPALREAILNALVHRDYEAFDGGLSLAIHPDRLEIWNSGELPEGLTLSDLPLGGISRPHNPDIAYVLFQVGLIERLGIGGRQIVSACQNAGLPTPTWARRGGGILLTFWNEEQKDDASRLPDRVRGFIEALSPGQSISASDYHRQTNVSARQARADLSRLVELGVLERKGSGTSTVYQVTDKQLVG